MSGASSIWVKICANTSLEDARLAADSGADAVGFVFAPSPRRVSVEQVAAIVPHLAAEVEKIGVFVDATLDQICATVHSCGLTGVQLHSAAEAHLMARLRDNLGAGVRIVGVVHFGEHAAERVASIAADSNVNAVLVDSRTATAVGGTGTTFDWAVARKTLFESAATGTRMIAAGGLTPENVREAIATLQPWGVDVASGVEAAPGKKDAEKVRRFVANARTSSAR